MATPFTSGSENNNGEEEVSSSVGSSEEEDMLLDIFDVDDDKSNDISVDHEDGFVKMGVIGEKIKEDNTESKPTRRNLSQSRVNTSSLNKTVPKSHASSLLKPSQKLLSKSCRHHEQRWCQKNVSGAFAELRKLVPTYPVDRKLNKNEILRMTIQYIRLLVSVREWQDNNLESNSADMITQRNHLAIITRQNTVMVTKTREMSCNI